MNDLKNTEAGKEEKKNTGKMQKLEFRLGGVGRIIPICAAAVIILYAAFHQSNVNGYVAAFFAAITVGVLFAKDGKAYGEAIVYGLSRPMFGVIVLAVILAAVSGKLIAGSGLIQTLAYYVINAGFSGKMFVAAVFIITCILAFSTGTSVGSYFVVIPILFPVGVLAGISPEYLIGAIVSGAAFGDNLGPISDTTIASSGTQKAELGGVVKSRTRYSIPAAIGALILFLIFTKTGNSIDSLSVNMELTPKLTSLFMLIIPVVIIVLCLMRKHLITALSYGILSGIVVGLLTGIYSLGDIITFSGGFTVTGLVLDGILGTAGTVMMLIAAFALLGVMECSGLFEDVGRILLKHTGSARKAEGAIVLSVGILSMITGVISVAIVALGDIVREVGSKAGLDPYRRANLLDCTGCVFCFLAPWTVHCVIPAQLTVQFGEEFSVAPQAIPFVNFYSICMLLILIISIITGYGRTYNIEEIQSKSSK